MANTSTNSKKDPPLSDINVKADNHGRYESDQPDSEPQPQKTSIERLDTKTPPRTQQQKVKSTSDAKTPRTRQQKLRSTSMLNTFTCDVCYKSFTRKYSFTRHMFSHSGKPKCSFCHQYFNDVENLYEHNKKKHSEGFLCSWCGKSYKRKEELDLHSLTAHGKSESGKLLICPFDSCKKAFIRPNRYQSHLNKHSGLKPYTCSKCQKAFSSSSYKHEHERSCKSLVKQICQQCGREFNYRAALVAHIEASHKGVLSICRCGKRFRYKTSLFRHKQNCNSDS